ncbi:hypothetical protein H9P43_004430 [Blastocladiella emersonii ATCC 22665]|nr:hypothetical protein H9P43_004430 [Blastocladiella emersonii ATCC 22665]
MNATEEQEFIALSSDSDADDGLDGPADNPWATPGHSDGESGQATPAADAGTPSIADASAAILGAVAADAALAEAGTATAQAVPMAATKKRKADELDSDDDDNDDDGGAPPPPPPPAIPAPVFGNPNSNKRPRVLPDDFSGAVGAMVAGTGRPIWVRSEPYSTDMARMLHEEIVDFVEFMQPTEEEHFLRELVVSSVQSNVEKCISKQARVLVFGSFQTQLYLPHSDIDMTVQLSNGGGGNRYGTYQQRSGPNYIHRLANQLRNSGEYSKVEAIPYARVPIVKAVHKQTGFCIDVSIDQTNGLDTVDLVRRRMVAHPALRPLVLVLKMFLFSRELNEVFTGGISSYTIITMTLAFLNTHPLVSARKLKPEENLGTMLVEWLELYGLSHNARSVAVYESKFVDKNRTGIRNMQGPGHYMVIDPGNRDNNLTAGARLTEQIKAAFASSYQFLTHAMYKSKANNRTPRTLLGLILKIDPRIAARRSQLVEIYKKLMADVDRHDQKQAATAAAAASKAKPASLPRAPPAAPAAKPAPQPPRAKPAPPSPDVAHRPKTRSMTAAATEARRASSAAAKAAPALTKPAPAKVTETIVIDDDDDEGPAGGAESEVVYISDDEDDY